MSPTAFIVLVLALVAASLVGWLLTRRSGVLTETTAAAEPELVAALGLSSTGPTVLHFSAPWCGPCVAVRKVVDTVCAELGGVAHVEIDMDADPAAAARLSVLSLPTTFVFDASGHQRYRVSGVPKASDLQSALRPLLP